MSQPVLVMEKICKSFPFVQALKDVDLTVYAGQVNVLVGENGAGKSTLMKIISGAYQPTSGTYFLDGRPVAFKSPHESEQAGIGVVYQELTLLPRLSIAENLFLGQHAFVNRFGKIQWKRMYREAAKLLREYLGLEIDPRTRVCDLGISQQQMIEIVKVINRKVKIMILDEPTAALTQHEVEKLFALIQLLKTKKVGIIYITHRMEEIFRIGDNITVLRDGEKVGEIHAKDANYDLLVSMMVGREMGDYFPREDFSGIPRRELLRVEHLTREGVFQDVSFSAYTGEILGIAGLMGAGRTEIARAIFGADRITEGSVFLEGERVTVRSPQKAIAKGLALLPEDRKAHGLVLNRSVAENQTIANLRGVSNRWGVLQKKREEEVSRSFIKELRIATPGGRVKIRTLSGGNQQKVIIARWIFANSKVVIFDEPTRGIDVGAKVEVYRLMNRMVRENRAVIMISSELPELIGICDRIITVRGGRITGELTGNLNEQAVMRCMLEEGE